MERFIMSRRQLTYQFCKCIALQCASRSELNTLDPAVYQTARRHGWLDDFYSIQQHRILTYALCKDIASHYNSREELDKADHSVCQKCREMGWLNEFFPVKNSGRELSYEFVKAVAQQYNNVKTMQMHDSPAYNKARTMGWLDEFFPDRKTPRCLTYKTCKDFAAKFDKCYDMQQADPQIYNKCRVNGWLDEFFPNRTKFRVLTYELCKSITAQYQSLADLRKDDVSVYDKCRKMGWTELLSHLEHITDNTIEGDRIETLYVYEFTDTNTAYVGRTNRKLAIRHREHCELTDPVAHYAHTLGCEVPKPKIIVQYPFHKYGKTYPSKLERDVIALYKLIGWNLINKDKGGSLGVAKQKYTVDDMQKVASGYVFWSDFRHDYPNIYHFIVRQHLQSKFPHLKYKHASYSNLSKSEIYKIASQFKSRTDFGKAYDMLCRRCRQAGWLDEWFDSKTGNGKQICQYTLTGEKISTYKSISSAAKQSGIDRKNIRFALNGIWNSAGGYKWAYADAA